MFTWDYLSMVARRGCTFSLNTRGEGWQSLPWTRVLAASVNPNLYKRYGDPAPKELWKLSDAAERWLAAVEQCWERRTAGTVYWKVQGGGGIYVLGLEEGVHPLEVEEKLAAAQVLPPPVFRRYEHENAMRETPYPVSACDVPFLEEHGHLPELVGVRRLPDTWRPWLALVSGDTNMGSGHFVSLTGLGIGFCTGTLRPYGHPFDPVLQMYEESGEPLPVDAQLGFKVSLAKKLCSLAYVPWEGESVPPPAEEG